MVPVQGAAVPAVVAELVLALPDPLLGSLPDRLHDVGVPLAQLPLLVHQPGDVVADHPRAQRPDVPAGETGPALAPCAQGLEVRGPGMFCGGEPPGAAEELSQPLSLHPSPVLQPGPAEHSGMELSWGRHGQRWGGSAMPPTLPSGWGTLRGRGSTAAAAADDGHTTEGGRPGPGCIPRPACVLPASRPPAVQQGVGRGSVQKDNAQTRPGAAR